MSVRTHTLQDVGRLLVRLPMDHPAAICRRSGRAPVLARFAPARYRSETLIMVVPQRVPDNYVKPTVTKPSKIACRQSVSRSSVARAWSGSSRRWTYIETARAPGDGGYRSADALDVTRQRLGKEANSFRVSYVSEAPRRRAR